MSFQTLLTDNATLTDAAVGFYSIEHKFDISTSVMRNWLKYLENSVLYEKMIVDDNVFNNQSWTQRLKADFNNVEGVNIDPLTRKKINEVADLNLNALDAQEFKDIHNNQTRSNIKRLLFYLSLSDHLNSTYSPSSYRNSLFEGISNLYKLEDTKTKLESKLLDNVISAATTYATNVENESGIKLMIAELPAISSLVIDQAVKCGSWTEAIYNIKQKQTAQHFREWASEVSESLQNSNTNALSRLAKVNNFIKGWGQNESGGMMFKVNFSIGSVLNTFKIPIKTEDISLSLKNPIPKKHLVFLNDTFHSLTSSSKNWEKIKGVRV